MANERRSSLSIYLHNFFVFFFISVSGTTIRRTFTQRYLWQRRPRNAGTQHNMSQTIDDGTELSRRRRTHTAYARICTRYVAVDSHSTPHNMLSKHCNYARGNAHIIRSKTASSIVHFYAVYFFIVFLLATIPTIPFFDSLLLLLGTEIERKKSLSDWLFV